MRDSLIWLCIWKLELAYKSPSSYTKAIYPKMTIWTDHEYFNWAVSGRASKSDKSHQSQRRPVVRSESVPCVRISINIQRCCTIIGWFEKCHIIEETVCINQLNGDTLSVSGYSNAHVLVTKISSKAVSIDHSTEGCKKCVNMGGCHPGAVRYILSKSIMPPTLRVASHTCALQTMHSILLFILLQWKKNESV